MSLPKEDKRLRYASLEDWDLDCQEETRQRALRPGDEGYEAAPFELGVVFMKEAFEGAL